MCVRAVIYESLGVSGQGSLSCVGGVKRGAKGRGMFGNVTRSPKLNAFTALVISCPQGQLTWRSRCISGDGGKVNQ